MAMIASPKRAACRRFGKRLPSSPVSGRFCTSLQRFAPDRPMKRTTCDPPCSSERAGRWDHGPPPPMRKGPKMDLHTEAHEISKGATRVETIASPSQMAQHSTENLTNLESRQSSRCQDVLMKSSHSCAQKPVGPLRRSNDAP